jgi:hypothetical protein
MQASKCGCDPIQSYLQKQVEGCSLPICVLEEYMYCIFSGLRKKNNACAVQRHEKSQSEYHHDPILLGADEKQERRNDGRE